MPLKNPLITSEHLQEKLVQPANEHAVPLALEPTEPLLQDSIPDVPAKTHSKKEAKRLQKLHKQQLKQQKKKANKKQQKNEKNNNSSKKRAKEKRASPTKGESDRSSGDNQQISKHLTNVKFAFDDDESGIRLGQGEIDGGFIQRERENETEQQSPRDDLASGSSNFDNRNIVIEVIEPGSPNDKNETTTKTTELAEINGNYDILPLIRIEHDLHLFNGHHQRPQHLQFLETNLDTDDVENNNICDQHKAICFTRSSDSIPFIDESPRRTAPGNYHDARFITIQPQNIGSQSYVYARKIEKIHTMKVPKREQFDKSAQILYQSLKESIDHHFERVVGSVESKLCQVCHEFLLVPETVKCLTCGLVCHHSCTTSPKVCI